MKNDEREHYNSYVHPSRAYILVPRTVLAISILIGMGMASYAGYERTLAKDNTAAGFGVVTNQDPVAAKELSDMPNTSTEYSSWIQDLVRERQTVAHMPDRN